MKRCRHIWTEMRRSYSPPRLNAELERGSESLVRQLTFGVTTVELRCEACGEVKETLLTGRAL